MSKGQNKGEASEGSDRDNLRRIIIRVYSPLEQMFKHFNCEARYPSKQAVIEMKF